MKKTLLFVVGALCLILITCGIFGVRYFNGIWFKERGNYLSLSSDLEPIQFQWSESLYGDYLEKNDAILIPAKIGTLPHTLHFQFDTGDPTTRMYTNSLESLKRNGVDIKELSKDGKRFVEEIHINMGGSQIVARMIEIDDFEVDEFGEKDTLDDYRIGTVGADFLINYITEIDFKNQIIQMYQTREPWMTSANEFTTFDFRGRRFMLPCEIGHKKHELFYDSGSSVFGLITTKGRYENYSEPSTREISYHANNHGNAIPIKHKATMTHMRMAGVDLALQRVSYVDMYSNLQGLITPFTRIGGWLGNKPFIDHSLIFDVKNEEFVVVKK